MNIPRFHLAFPVHDLELAREFYTNILGCTLGRESKKWIDFNMHGHQVVAHLSPKDCKAAQSNSVDGNQVPARHFGIILPWEDWETLGEKIRKFILRKKVNYNILCWMYLTQIPLPFDVLFHI